MAVPEFILTLRQHIGHAPLWLPGVTAVIRRTNEADLQVLLVRRSDNGRWAPVIEIIDPGEQPAAAATRETLEETGVRITIDRIASVTAHPPDEPPERRPRLLPGPHIRLHLARRRPLPGRRGVHRRGLAIRRRPTAHGAGPPRPHRHSPRRGPDHSVPPLTPAVPATTSCLGSQSSTGPRPQLGLPLQPSCLWSRP